MASQVCLPKRVIVLSENNASLVISSPDWYDQYSSNSYPLRYEVVNLEPEFNSSMEGASSLKSSAISDPIEDILINLHELGVTVVSSFKVFEYLYKFPDVAKLSGEVSNLVYQYFDSNAKLHLEVRDPDDPDCEYLALIIRLPEYNDGVMEQIEKIRERYYSLLDDIAGWFLFTTDFRPPR